MEKCGAYMGMVTVQVAQVGLMIAGKVAMANGMTTFTFACYSNSLASLLLLPVSSFILYRSNGPPVLGSFVYGFLVLGFMGFLVQILGYSGLKYASAMLSTSMLNLIPAFTFVFAVILRLEKFNHRSTTTLAKVIGTLVSIAGALIITLYQGPPILGISPHSNTSSSALATSSAWLLGGLLLAIDSVLSSLFIIAQALVLKKCPFELVLMFFYSLFVSILSAVVSLVTEKDFSAWSLADKSRLVPVIYSALFGNVFQVSLIMWCVRQKGPLFASVFHPLGVIFAIAMGIVVLGESLYLGSIVGSVVVVVGFYSVMWGKANEIEEVTKAVDSNGKRTPLLENNTMEA